MTTEPASIRYNNPGAMWGGNAVAKRWGATATIALNDGLNQGNTIAFFPSKVAGACAEFDLWRSNYCNLTLQGAISKWSGGNSSAAYMETLTRKSGISASEIITPALLASSRGLALIKAQAQWEAGQVYPLSDAQWQQAQAAVFKGVSGPVIASGSVAGGSVVAAQQAHAAGYHWGAVVGILAVGLIIAAVIYLILMKNKSDSPQPLPIPTPPLPGPARPRIPDVPGGRV